MKPAPIAEAKPALDVGAELKTYGPLINIVLISAVTAAASQYTGRALFMDMFMGLFLLQIAALKLFDLDAFAKSYARYDLLAKAVPSYGFIYPFLELGLGINFLSGYMPLSTNILLLLLMIIGTPGVLRIIAKGEKVQCACVGTGFNLPVGKVTLAENLAMAAMAAVNIGHML